MHRRVALLTILLVSLAATPPVAPATGVDSRESTVAAGAATDALDGTASTTAARTADATITRTLSLRLTPTRPGEVEATVSFEIPDEVTELTLQLQSNADVRSTERFRSEGRDEYAWTGEGNGGSVTFTYDANETREGARRPALDHEAGEGYAFVDAGDWAITRVPGLGSSWRWSGVETVDLDKRVEVDGEGTTGGYMAYLGPMRTYTETVRDQELTLAVPDAADLRESPTAVLASLANASEELHVGQRDGTALVVAAPASVDWSSAGLQYGDTDAWVVADARLDTANNVWLHEYVHTRQEFRPNRSASWVVEGSADYYAALLAYEQGHIGYDVFREKLARGTEEPQSSAVLAEPATWSDGANYRKGSLVVGSIDRELRAATDGRATFQQVFGRLNARETNVDDADVLAAVEAASTTDVRRYADRYTTSSDAPEPWSRTTHDDLFGATPASFVYTLGDDALSVSGPYRNDTVSTTPTLAVGERLTLRPTVENVGGDVGAYDVAFTVDGTTRGSETGELEPGERTTLSFAWTFDEPGTYAVTVADRERTVTVREPATPHVTSVEAPETVTVGEAFAVEAAIENGASWPAGGDVAISLDGETSLTETVRLPPESRLSYTGPLVVDEPGEHVVRVGEQRVTVTAVEREATDDADSTASDGGTDGSVPGFGVAAALVAMVLVAGARLWRP